MSGTARQPCLGGCGTVTSRQNKSGYCSPCSRTHLSTQRRKPSAVGEGEGLHERGDARTLTVVTPERVRTLEDLIRVCQIDTDEWAVDRWVANKWEMGARGGEGVQTTPLFQVKAWLVRNRPVRDAKMRINALIRDAKAHTPRVAKIARAVPKSKHLLELAIPDLHLGKLAWGEETGYADYDLKIAERLYEEALDALLQRTASFPLSRIVLPIGNDFFHSDTKQGTTTKGTPLDNDSRYHKAFLVGRRLMTKTVDRLKALAPVTVVIVPGNHSSLSEFHLGDSLECWFHKDANVTVMNQPIPRKYFRFGNTALCFTHGDKGKPADWPLLFATEQPEMFGQTKFREIHVGHLHQTRVTEKMGVRVRISPALCSPDSWHSENHFVGQVRGAEALVYHDVEGLVSVAHFNVVEEKR